MIEVKENGQKFVVTTTIIPPAIYLDHWAIREISSNPELMDRFLLFFKTKGTLLFSLANVLDISQTQGDSLERIKVFLEKVGLSWFPIEFNPSKVIAAEEQYQAGGPAPFFAAGFLEMYYPNIHGRELTLKTLVDLAYEDGSLSPIVKNTLDDLVESFSASRDLWNSEGRKRATTTTFTADQPTRFVYDGLMRLLFTEKSNLNRNQIMDFFHATVSLAYADVVLLDKQWENLAFKIKSPRRIKVYSPPRLAEFFDDLENDIWAPLAPPN